MSYTEIQKSKGTILIDNEDMPLIKGWGCWINKDGYVTLEKTFQGKRTRHRLSRFIMSPLSGLVIDHINHNTLDNRRCNLRICTRGENARNNRGHSGRHGSRFKGVFYHDHAKYAPQYNCTNAKPWRAYTRMNGKRIYFGYHNTEDDAARAYNKGVKKLFGEFAYLNSPTGAGVGSF